ncbi:hypothetical protein LCGC14_1631070 [marine sediment metagenome]|uniref:Uncharacterized protein n=1 Tax=marine sediment metagenome TaxID=412755 RepID=A0A0F9IPR5_9ZZZZ
MLFEKNKTYTEAEIMKHARNGGKVGVAISILTDDCNQYDFHPSDRGYMLHEVSGKQVNPLTRVEANKQYFIVTEQHIKLLGHLWIRWELTAYEHGVPCVDSKRPYGNSGILDAIIDILDLPYNEDLDGYSDELESSIRKLHHETLICMQILVRNASIELGEYVADKHDQNWRPLQ